MFEPIYDSGLVPILVDVLRHFFEDDTFTHSATSSLFLMAKNHNGIKEQILSAGGVNVTDAIEKKGGPAAAEVGLLCQFLQESEKKVSRANV